MYDLNIRVSTTVLTSDGKQEMCGTFPSQIKIAMPLDIRGTAIPQTKILKDIKKLIIDYIRNNYDIRGYYINGES